MNMAMVPTFAVVSEQSNANTICTYIMNISEA
jgi:hypothetical protein